MRDGRGRGTAVQSGRSRATARRGPPLALLLFASCDGGEAGPAADAVAGATDADALPAPDAGTPERDAREPGPLLDDAGQPGATTCVTPPDAEQPASQLQLALRLVELAGQLSTPGLDLPADCARGLFLSPAPGPALVQLRSDQGNFDLPVDCRGRFRALVPPGRYRVLATLQWLDPVRGESFSWADDLLPEPLELRSSTTFPEPLALRFATLSGQVTFDGQARFADATDPAAPGAPCLAMSVDERRTNGVTGTRGFFHADCAGRFAVRVTHGEYGLDLLGPSPGREARVRLAAGNWRLTPAPIPVRGDTRFAADVPLARLRGTLTAPFPLPCAGSGARVDLQSADTGNVYGVPVCDGALDAWLSPGSYGATLIAQGEAGSARVVLPGAVTVGADGATLDRAVAAQRVSGRMRIDGSPAVHGSGMGTANVLLLGARNNGYTAWIQPGAALSFSAWLAPDRYDLLVYASGTLPGGRYADDDFLDLEQGTPPPVEIDVRTVPVAGEITFGGQPAGDRCEGYTVSFQRPSIMGPVNVTPRCEGGRLRFSATVYADDYRVVVRRPNVLVETPIPTVSFRAPRLDLVADLAALDEHPVRGHLAINGCVLRERPGRCGASYVVTLRDPSRGVAYTLPPAFQDQPFRGAVLPGTYKAGVRFSALCDDSPFAGLRGEIALPEPVVVP